ncbi:MAG: hypothetical protein LBM04_10790 [Opitutaceae bacterium]|jgi:hypothetical protein|nr:hypothetical protein [Opitutaceae bacterium]
MFFSPAYLIFAATVLLLSLMRYNRAAGSPIIALANRWLRWAIFATGGAYLLKRLELVDHPFWLLMLIFALIWFLIETLYNWMAIGAYSESDLPLFPRYEPNDTGENWPTLPRFLKLRDEIRANGFVHMRSMRARVIENIWVRVSVYQDAAATTRVQVTFLPQAGAGGVAASISTSSLTTGGHRYVTDNTFMPYAGFYPENWLVERKPWMRSLNAILKYHRDRLAKNNETLAPDTAEPMEEINAHQRAVEQLNIELGFLTPHSKREEFGRITNAGRYRTWKELWMLNYLGRSMRYL